MGAIWISCQIQILLHVIATVYGASLKELCDRPGAQCIELGGYFPNSEELVEIRINPNDGIFEEPKSQNVGKLPIDKNLGQNEVKLASSKPFKPIKGGKKFENVEAVRNGSCYNDATNVNVYAHSESDNRKLYSVCFDEKLSKTLYSSSYIDGIGKKELGRGSTTFHPMNFYDFDVKKAYTLDQELETFDELLGVNRNEEYIGGGQYQLSRGHLFPNGDPNNIYQKVATFLFINVVPQWQILNGGNWLNVETSVRSLAESLETSNLLVWTGAYEVLKLPNDEGKDVEIWMYNQKSASGEIVQQKLPTPKYLWKVVYHKPQNASIAIVQINNPFADIKKEVPLCKDICDSIHWLKRLNKSQRSSVKRGYTYCCDVNDLRKKIPYIPQLNYSKILIDGTADSEDESNSEETEEIEDEENDSSSEDNESDEHYAFPKKLFI